MISELLFVPGGTAGRSHANFHLYMLPADLSVVGSIHSHPSGALIPSGADLRLFRHWGRRHLILGAPYGPGCWRAYDGNGDETTLEVVASPSARDAGTPLRQYRPRPLHRAERPPVGTQFPADEA